MDCLASARYGSMTCLRLLIGLGRPGLTCSSRRFTGKGTGIFSGADFFLLRKNADDFFVTVGGAVLTLEALELTGSLWTCLGRRARGAAELSLTRTSGLSTSSEADESGCGAPDSSRAVPEGTVLLLDPNMRRKNPGLSLRVDVGLASMKTEFSPGELTCVGNDGKASRLCHGSVDCSAFALPEAPPSVADLSFRP